MNAPARLIGFAAVLALVFATAAFAGSRIDAHPGGSAPEEGGMHGMESEEGPVAQAVRGLAVSDRGLTLQLERATAPEDERFELAFRIVDRAGRAVRDFDVEHTRRMHLIVVRRDMTGFQHLHPTIAADGTWRVPVTLPDAGAYRVFADFAVDGEAHTLADDLTVDGTAFSHELPAPAGSVEVDGMRVALTDGASSAGAVSELAFEVTRDGKPVELEQYLGAMGHLVALREGDLAFLHVHPDENSLRFTAEFPSAGRYRLFLQFQTGGRVHTAAFTQELPR